MGELRVHPGLPHRYTQRGTHRQAHKTHTDSDQVIEHGLLRVTTCVCLRVHIAGVLWASERRQEKRDGDIIGNISDLDVLELMIRHPPLLSTNLSVCSLPSLILYR